MTTYDLTPGNEAMERLWALAIASLPPNPADTELCAQVAGGGPDGLLYLTATRLSVPDQLALANEVLELTQLANDDEPRQHIRHARGCVSMLLQHAPKAVEDFTYLAGTWATNRPYEGFDLQYDLVMSLLYSEELDLHEELDDYYTDEDEDDE